MTPTFPKSGYSTEKSGYVDTPFRKECQTCEYFKKPNLCKNDTVAGDSALLTEPKSGLKLVDPVNGCCNEWEPVIEQPQNLVYVARHGETKLNAANSFRGNVDVDLDEKGIEQAEELRAFISGIPFFKFICSSKIRTEHTMEIILCETRTYESVAGLQALNVGKFSGQPKNKENLKELEYYIKHPKIPIPGGESLQQFQERVRPILKSAIYDAMTEKKPVFILGHSSIVHEVGAMLHHNPNSVLVEPGGCAVIFKRPSGKLDARAILNPKTSKIDVVS